MLSPEADGRAEAGSSTVAVFKKRGSGRAKANVGVKSSAVDDDVLPASKTSQGAEAGDDEEAPRLSVADLVTLRSLRNKPQGIDLNRLNKGEVKKKKKRGKAQAANLPQTEEERWAEQMQRGGLVTRHARKTAQGQTDVDDDDDDDGDDDDSDGGNGAHTARKGGARLIKENNFQGETGTVDVDKHMMAYIEEEMQKRRSGEAVNETVLAATKAVASQSNPASGRTAEDELYSIADKYQQIQQSAKDAIAFARSQVHANGERQAASSDDKHKDCGDDDDDDNDDEGNVALSTSMLTSVPEIDLGMEVRMRNIEATERARKAMEEAQRSRRNDDYMDDSAFAAARFFRHPNREPSDAERFRRMDESHAFPSDTVTSDTTASTGAYSKKRQTATDDVVLDRYKKRQRNQLKR